MEDNEATSQKQKKVPYYRKPEDLSIDEWQAALRKQFAADQDFDIKNIGNHPVFSDFEVYNPKSEKTYKVSIRDNVQSHNFCSCPDFKVNGLGTCKHIENVLLTLKKKKSNWKYFNQTQPHAYASLSIYYGKERSLRLKPGSENGEKIKQLFNPIINNEGYIQPGHIMELERYIQKATSIDPNFRVYPDVYEFIQGCKQQIERERLTDKIFPEGTESRIFEELIKTKLYPYQKEAVLKAFKAGRVLIADEMGLGKTIQAIATVELFARYSQVRSVLIVCPTSLKYQWQKEIEKFTDRTTLMVEGLIHKRKKLYKQEEFYKIISYGVTRNDLEHINEASPDLVILDEAQRIKNWQTKTAQAVKKIQSRFALVLTGTPLENRLQELHSIVEFIDMYKLGPLFRFLHNHEITDEAGKVTGYRNLKSINKTLEPILIRRTKKEIINQLPGRIDKNFFVELTEEQMKDHHAYYENVCRLVNKWRRQGFLNEEDRQNLLINLSCMRMTSDSTYILNPQKRHDNKIGELIQLLENVMETEDNKIVIFSEWKKMLELVIQALEKRGIDYVYLNGDLSTKERKRIISRFHSEKRLKIFLSTDSGGLGLNLQCANVIVNLDLPWNPAKLEQRIARVYRLGQNQHVYIYNFISKYSIEHRIFYLLGFKKSVFSGTLDGEKDTVRLDDKGFMETVETLTEVNPENGKDAAPGKEKVTVQGEDHRENERVKEYQSDENELWNDREGKDKKEKEAEEKDLNGEKSVTRQKTGKQKEGIFRRIGKGFRKLLKKFR
ncbi:MAG: DEAD/DEAH box helicase [Bacteroidales bacterium]|nr:DEAD/DEAH box helicase [Bacteroidales bacterium]